MFLNKYNYLLQLILINLSIFIILPFNLVVDKSNNLNEYLSFDIFILSFNIFIFFSILTVLIAYILKKFFSLDFFKKNNLVNNFIIFSLVWVFIIGFFFPVTGQHDPFLSSFFSIKFRYFLILKLLLILFITTFIIRKNLLKIFQFFLVLYLLANLMLILFNLIFYKNNQLSPEINKFGKKNLIVLSLDGISGLKINEEIEKNLEFKNKLKDFKFYENVTSAWPATINSLNAELNSKVLKINKKNLDKNILNNKTRNTIVYGNYKHFINNKDRVVIRGKYKDYGNSYDINSFFQRVTIGTFTRWSTPLILSYFENTIVYSIYYKKILELISLDFNNKNNPYNQEISTKYMMHMNEFDYIFNDTLLDKDLEETIRMYHFSFSHWPLRLNENCKEVKSLKVPLYDQENIAIKCLIKKISYFLKVLQHKDIYNNSMIIIKSDHGKPYGYYNKFPHNLKINNSRYWGLGRYKAFIMIKNANYVNDKIKTINNHVFLHDLAKTYCNFFNTHNYCNQKYIGNNLLSDISDFSTYNYEIYIPKKLETFLNIDDFEKYTITNNVSLYESLKLNNINLKK